MEESGQRRNACTKNAQILLRREGCALSTGQRSNFVAVMDAQTHLRNEDYVGGTERIALYTMNQLHLDQN
jgi:septum formation inhibitor-activating ATPase MinD